MFLKFTSGGSAVCSGQMQAEYDELLDATIRHLKDLRAGGERHVVVSPDAMAALTKAGVPAAKRATAPVGAPSRMAPPESRPAAETFRAERPRPAFPTPEERPPAADPVRAAAPRLTGEAKTAAMAELRAKSLACVKCPNLVRTRKSVVFGVGDINARLMFVGEAPGADEDKEGEPFVGKAGQLLTKIIQTMGLSRETVYIANVLKCRPDTPGEAFGNRKPSPDEMRNCLPYLQSQIDLIQPEAIVALGGTAMEGLFNRTIYITKVRGQFHTFQNIPVMPTYHPSYLLRNQALSVKREIWEDMLKVMETLRMPISDKQRGYFKAA